MSAVLDTPERAIARWDGVSHLRSYFMRRVSELNVKRGVPMMFSRFLVDQDHTAGADPLVLPWPDHTQLRVELAKEGVSPVDLDHFQYDLTAACARLASDLALASTAPSASGMPSGPSSDGAAPASSLVAHLIRPASPSDPWTVSCGGLSYLIHRSHLDKLHIFYTSTQSSPDSTPDVFAARVFCLLSRYTLLDDVGYQAALAPSVFASLSREFGVSCECFASPLNCHYRSFCSAFPDTDAPFGSLGSFFDYFPTSGSFEANPPFTEPLIRRTASHIESLLSAAEHSDAPLSFVVCVPCWADSDGFVAMRQSRFLARFFAVDGERHGYVVGDQHVAKVARLPASFETAVFVLQNAAATKVWAPTDARVEELRRAFEASRPRLSPEEERRREEQRRRKRERDRRDARPQEVNREQALKEYVSEAVLRAQANEKEKEG